MLKRAARAQLCTNAIAGNNSNQRINKLINYRALIEINSELK
jgi:hypothetical protein